MSLPSSPKSFTPFQMLNNPLSIFSKGDFLLTAVWLVIVFHRVNNKDLMALSDVCAV